MKPGDFRLPPHYYLVKYDDVAYCPHVADGVFQGYLRAVDGKTAMGGDSLYTLYLMAKQCAHLEGEFWECGVDRGGSAKAISQTIAGRTLRLFDTFSGMPQSDAVLDRHDKGDFSATSPAMVKELVSEANVYLHPGVIPETFRGLEHAHIAFAHIDCDIYQSTVDCCEFIYPRLVAGGVMIFDDYTRHTCPGVRKAVDEYFADKPEEPLPSITTSQAVVFKQVKLK